MKESDNNVKLIVLDRLTALKDTRAHEKVLQVRCGVVSMYLCTVELISSNLSLVYGTLHSRYSMH